MSVSRAAYVMSEQLALYCAFQHLSIPVTYIVPRLSSSLWMVDCLLPSDSLSGRKTEPFLRPYIVLLG